MLELVFLDRQWRAGRSRESRLKIEERFRGVHRVSARDQGQKGDSAPKPTLLRESKGKRLSAYSLTLQTAPTTFQNGRANSREHHPPFILREPCQQAMGRGGAQLGAEQPWEAGSRFNKSKVDTRVLDEKRGRLYIGSGRANPIEKRGSLRHGRPKSRSTATPARSASPLIFRSSSRFLSSLFYSTF